MTTHSPVSAQTHQYFLQEAAELMQIMDEDLQNLRHDFHVQKVHNLMRAAHTLKGAAASVGLDAIKNATHSIEDVFKALCHQDAVISAEMEGLIFGAYECLQLLISAQHSGASGNDSYIVDRMANTVTQLQDLLGDRFGQEGYLPSSSELGFDMTQSIFETGVSPRLSELSDAITQGNAVSVTALLKTQSEIFVGLAESLELPGFGKIAQTVLDTLEQYPQQSLEIATIALENYTAAKELVLSGDRDQGGVPLASLLSFGLHKQKTEQKTEQNPEKKSEQEKEPIVIDTDWLLSPSDPNPWHDDFPTDPVSILEFNEDTDDETRLAPSTDSFIEPPLELPGRVPHSFSSTPVELANARWPENIWNILTRPIGVEKTDNTATKDAGQFIQYTIDYPLGHFSNDACEPIPYDSESTDPLEEESVLQVVAQFGDMDAFYITPAEVEPSPLDLEQLAVDQMEAEDLEPIELSAPDSEPLNISSADPAQFELELSDIEQLDLELVESDALSFSEDAADLLPPSFSQNVDGTDSENLSDLADLITAATEDSLDELALLEEEELEDKTDPVIAHFVKDIPAVESASPSVSASNPTGESETVNPAPSRIQPTIRMNVEHVEKLSQAMGELLTQQNRQTLYSEQLTTLVKQLLEQTNQQFGIESPQQKTAEAIEMYVQRSQQTIEKQKRLLANTRETLLEARMLPMDQVFQRFPSALQRLKSQHNKPANLVLEGCEVLVDKSISDKLFDPLLHLVRNAFDHGIEPVATRQQQNKPAIGTITLSAKQQGRYLTIQVKDDGRGIDLKAVQQKAIERQIITPAEAMRLSPAQTVNLLFEPGFSTVIAVNDLSGRGVGLDAVQACVRSLKGQITITHTPNAGTCFTLKIPASLTIAKLLICQTQTQTYALIADAIEHILIPTPSQLRTWDGGKTLTWQNEDQEHLIPVHSLSSILRYSEPIENNPVPSPTKSTINAPIILIRYKDSLTDNSLLGIEVDQLIGEQELVINALGDAIIPPSYVYGSSILPTGRLTLVLDGVILSRTVMSRRSTAGNIEIDITENTAAPVQTELKATDDPTPINSVLPLILTIDDSLTVRSALADVLQKNGYQTIQAKDGAEALQKLRQYPTIQSIICDLEMPGMNGFEFLRIRQQQPDLLTIPTIMLSSRSTAHHRLLTQTLGATDHLTKPFSPPHLLSALAKSLKSKSLESKSLKNNVLVSIGGSSHE